MSETTSAMACASCVASSQRRARRPAANSSGRTPSTFTNGNRVCPRSVAATKSRETGMTATQKRFEASVEAARKGRGYLPPSMVYAASRDIDFIEAYDRLYANSLNDGKAFPAKYRELV